MSNIDLSNIQQIIERSLFERIRNEIVLKGYLPDIIQYTDDEPGVDAYKEMLSFIQTDKGFSIEVFSESSNYHKGIKKVPRIVVKTGSFLPGDLGGDSSRFYELTEDDNYLAKVTPPQTSDFFISFHLVSENIDQERVLNALLAIAIPRRKYIGRIDDPTKSFFIKYLNYYDVDDLDHGLIEKVYAYQIPDCWEINDEIVGTGIAKISNITLHTNIQKYLEGNWLSSTDTLVVE